MSTAVRTAPKTIKADTLSIDVVTVTPKQAAQWLESNDVNRNLRRKLVDAYRRDMEAGRWVFTAEPVQISRTGRLLNGQHRLHALAGSKVKGIQLLVATGLADEAQSMMDQGKPRGIRDALLIEHGHIKNLTLVSSLCRWLTLAPEVGPSMNPSSMRNKVTAAEALEVYRSDPEGLAEDAYRANSLREIIAGSPTAVGYTWNQLRKVDEAAAQEFFAGMADMEWSYSNDPRKAALRRMNQLHRAEEVKTSIETGVMLVSVMTRAWNAWRKQEEVESLNVKQPKTGAIILPVTPV